MDQSVALKAPAHLAGLVLEVVGDRGLDANNLSGPGLAKSLGSPAVGLLLWHPPILPAVAGGGLRLAG